MPSQYCIMNGPGTVDLLASRLDGRLVTFHLDRSAIFMWCMQQREAEVRVTKLEPVEGSGTQYKVDGIVTMYTKYIDHKPHHYTFSAIYDSHTRTGTIEFSDSPQLVPTAPEK